MPEILKSAWTQLAKSPMFTVFGFVALGLLAAVAFVNHEAVGAYVAAIAAAFYGGGAWKNHSDQRYGNGKGDPS